MSGETPQAGFDAKAYLNTGTYASPVWNEMKHIIDASNPDSNEAIDVSARYSARKRFMPGMAEDSIDFGYQWIKGLNDAVFTALETAKKNRTLIEIRMADGDITVNGTRWWRDTFMVEKFDRKEDLGDKVSYDVTVKPAVQFQSNALVERTYGVIGS